MKNKSTLERIIRNIEKRINEEVREIKTNDDFIRGIVWVREMIRYEKRNQP